MKGDGHSCSYSATSIRNGLISGYTAGICGIVIGHPLDSLKVLLQTRADNPASGSGGRSGVKVNSSNFVISRASSTAAAAAVSSQPSRLPTSKLVIPAGKRSFTSLYAGVTGPLLTVGLIQSINFALYDSVRRVLYQRQLLKELERDNHVIVGNGLPDDYLHYDNLQNVAISSFISGGATSFLTSPVTMVKTKQQIMQWSFRRAIEDTWSRGNSRLKIHNFYTGFGIHFCCDAFGRSVYMFTYEFLKRSLSEHQNADNDSTWASPANLSIPQRMICAASAGMICWTFIYPADVIRSKLYSQSLHSQSLPTTMDGIRLAHQMLREAGFRSLYHGMPISVARAGPVAAAILPVYDYMLEMIS
jgi:solute carrier family 25 carnitine/acylcarnitine transporter 20/29